MAAVSVAIVEAAPNVTASCKRTFISFAPPTGPLYSTISHSMRVIPAAATSCVNVTLVCRLLAFEIYAVTELAFWLAVPAVEPAPVFCVFVIRINALVDADGAL